MRFLIMEDDILFAKELKLIIKEYFNNIRIDINAYSTDDININKYDVFFLGLNNNDKNGFKFAQTINQTLLDHKLIIFIASDVELWKEIFAYHPFWCIDKATYQEDLIPTLKNLKKKLIHDYASIKVDYNGVIRRIRLKNINYIYKDKNYTYIHTENNEYKVHISLKNLLQQIDFTNLFIKINSGILVRKKYIKEYNLRTNEILLIDNQSFLVSRSHRKDLINLMRN